MAAPCAQEELVPRARYLLVHLRQILCLWADELDTRRDKLQLRSELTLGLPRPDLEAAGDHLGFGIFVQVLLTASAYPQKDRHTY